MISRPTSRPTLGQDDYSSEYTLYDNYVHVNTFVSFFFVQFVSFRLHFVYVCTHPFTFILRHIIGDYHKT